MDHHFQVRIVGREHARYPSHLACDHGCEYIIQVVTADTDDVLLEWCTLSAEQFAGRLLEAVELSHLSK
ncbi:hypothetical protein [Alicyclobacillus acidiphilus]|uniref:hypothetical protein n=1 Tax=Alicyclobacillus acidiphilus TaxID=182455 RepID=UPI0008308330|nr:hypothetical protein [Alicyclobacillus acidiphilus]